MLAACQYDPGTSSVTRIADAVFTFMLLVIRCHVLPIYRSYVIDVMGAYRSIYGVVFFSFLAQCRCSIGFLSVIVR